MATVLIKDYLKANKGQKFLCRFLGRISKTGVKKIEVTMTNDFLILTSDNPRFCYKLDNTFE